MVEHVVKIGDYTVGRVVQPPGFSWSKNIRPIVGGDWCAARHVGVVVSGRMGVELRDGARFELGPNDVFDIPPGHDAYVVGDEPLVEIDWSGLEAWTGFKVRLHDRVLAGLLMTDIVGSTAEASGGARSIRQATGCSRYSTVRHVHWSAPRRSRKPRGRRRCRFGSAFTSGRSSSPRMAPKALPSTKSPVSRQPPAPARSSPQRQPARYR